MATSSVSQRWNLILATAVIATLPLWTLIFLFNYAAVILADQRKLLSFRSRKRRQQRTVFITGVNNPYSLNLARAFYRAGYRVVGADLKTRTILNVAKRSRVLAKHFDLPQISAVQDIDYIAYCILKFVKIESVDLWIDCSYDIPDGSISLARKEAEQRNLCLCFTENEDFSSFFDSRERFIDFLKSRNLPTTEFHKVKSRAQIHNVLNEAQGKKQYVLSPAKSINSKTLLPRRTLSQTYNDISLLKFSPNSYMVLEELVDTSTKYECLALVVRGTVKSFWVQRKAGDVHEQLPQNSGLWQAFRGYTESVAHEFGDEFSNHLLLTFGVIEKVTHAGVVQQVLPADGAMRLNPNFVLSINRAGFNDLVKAYQSVFNDFKNGMSTTSTAMVANTNRTKIQPQMSRQHYFLMDELKEMFLMPCIGVLFFRTQVKDAMSSVVALLYRLLYWDEVFYDFWDPLPSYWTYSIVFLWQTLLG